MSALFNYPLGTCTVWAMRLTSLLASMLNVWLIYQIRRTALQLSGAKLKSLANVELETLTIALLPPLYMFAHLYYTDVVSLSSVLAMMLFSMRSEHNWAAFFGKSRHLYFRIYSQDNDYHNNPNFLIQAPSAC